MNLLILNPDIACGLLTPRILCIMKHCHMTYQFVQVDSKQRQMDHVARLVTVWEIWNGSKCLRYNSPLGWHVINVLCQRGYGFWRWQIIRRKLRHLISEFDNKHSAWILILSLYITIFCLQFANNWILLKTFTMCINLRPRLISTMCSAMG